LLWRLKDNKNFSSVFYKNQKECLKTANGKKICMKFYKRGVCFKSCPRAHAMSKGKEKSFDFIQNCREGASKPDF
jgi:hypothetical protein